MITIVSGLPRSGTSMMMQMLIAGGLPACTDFVRRPDVDNPLGYYEHEKVKRLKQDDAWFDEAEGRALKVVSGLLRELPQDRCYKVIFMQRRLDDVLASQARMLQRMGRAEDSPADAEMREYMELHLAGITAWLRGRPNMEIRYCDYHAMLAAPRDGALAIVRFLGLPLDVARMASAVRPELHR